MIYHHLGNKKNALKVGKVFRKTHIKRTNQTISYINQSATISYVIYLIPPFLNHQLHKPIHFPKLLEASKNREARTVVLEKKNIYIYIYVSASGSVLGSLKGQKKMGFHVSRCESESKCRGFAGLVMSYRNCYMKNGPFEPKARFKKNTTGLEHPEDRSQMYTPRKFNSEWIPLKNDGWEDFLLSCWNGKFLGVNELFNFQGVSPRHPISGFSSRHRLLRHSFQNAFFGNLGNLFVASFRDGKFFK